MLKLKLQYFGHLMWRADSFEKTLMLGKIKGRRRRGRQRMRWLDGITWVWVGSGSWWWIGRPGMLQSTGLQRVGHDWVTELNCPLISRNHYNWFEIIILKCTICFEFYEGCWILYSAFWVLFKTRARILRGTMKFTQPGKYGFTCVKKCTPSTGKWNPIPNVLMITRILSRFSLWNKQISSHKLWWHF